MSPARVLGWLSICLPLWRSVWLRSGLNNFLEQNNINTDHHLGSEEHFSFLEKWLMSYVFFNKNHNHIYGKTETTTVFHCRFCSAVVVFSNLSPPRSGNLKHLYGHLSHRLGLRGAMQGATTYLFFPYLRMALCQLLAVNRPSRLAGARHG